MLHVAQISFFLDPQRDAQRILQDWWALVDAAEMVAQTGASVSVVQACRESKLLERNSVQYHFVAPERGRSSITRNTGFAPFIRGLKADVFHIQGLCFPEDVRKLAQVAPETPLFIQDHAEKVPRLWRRRRFRRGSALAEGISFCSLEQTRPFVEAGLFHPRTALLEIPETSTRFAPGDQQAARLATGLHGDPAVLWVGHLKPGKDPLTVLAGIAAATDNLPGLQLWCCFGTAPLMAEVRQAIDHDRRLQGKVHLLGTKPHETIQQLMRAADVFVSGSRSEGSGCALVEALACGLPPVVTDIPSFRTLTAGARIGALWPCGDADGLRAALLSVAGRPREQLRAAVRLHFDKELSFDAVGRKLIEAYEAVVRLKAAQQAPSLISQG